MCAMGSVVASNEDAAPAASAKHVMVIGEDAFMDLEASLCSSEPSSRDFDEAFETYYDRTDYALSLRGWWLRERAGEWQLRVPTEQGQLGPTEELTDVSEILKRVGLGQYVQAWKDLPEDKRNLQKMLKLVNVEAFARVKCSRRVFQVPFDAVSSNSGAVVALKALAGEEAQLSVAIERVTLDVGLVENRSMAQSDAIAELLFEHGNKARDHLRLCVAEFALAGKALGAPATAEAARVLLAKLTDERGFASLSDRLAKDGRRCPKLMAFMRVLRPLHILCLERAGAVPGGETKNEKAVTPEDAD